MDRSAGEVYPVLPLRDIVVFPHMIVPLFVGRERSVRALEDVMKDDKQILLIAQKNAADDEPTADDIYLLEAISNPVSPCVSLPCQLIHPRSTHGPSSKWVDPMLATPLAGSKKVTRSPNPDSDGAS